MAAQLEDVLSETRLQDPSVLKLFPGEDYALPPNHLATALKLWAEDGGKAASEAARVLSYAQSQAQAAQSFADEAQKAVDAILEGVLDNYGSCAQDFGFIAPRPKREEPGLPSLPTLPSLETLGVKAPRMQLPKFQKLSTMLNFKRPDPNVSLPGLPSVPKSGSWGAALGGAYVAGALQASGEKEPKPWYQLNGEYNDCDAEDINVGTNDPQKCFDACKEKEGARRFSVDDKGTCHCCGELTIRSNKADAGTEALARAEAAANLELPAATEAATPDGGRRAFMMILTEAGADALRTADVGLPMLALAPFLQTVWERSALPCRGARARAEAPQGGDTKPRARHRCPRRPAGYHRPRRKRKRGIVAASRLGFVGRAFL